MKLTSHLARSSENLTSSAIAVQNNKLDNSGSKAIKILFKLNVLTKPLK